MCDEDTWVKVTISHSYIDRLCYSFPEVSYEFRDNAHAILDWYPHDWMWLDYDKE